MFGLFGKKQPRTAMDEFIQLMYGDRPPSKRAVVPEAVSLAWEQLLARLVSKRDVENVVFELSNGPIPYSTHELALAASLNLFKNPLYGPRLGEAQIAARMTALEWFQGGKVVAPLVKSFEDTLYALYKDAVADPAFAKRQGPSGFQSLAGIVKFLEAQRRSPTFFDRHWNAIEFTNAFTRLLVSKYPSLQEAVRYAVDASLHEGGDGLHQALVAAKLSDPDLAWFDSQMTEVLRMLVPVVRDAALPNYLADTKWAIEGAFEG